MRLIDAERFEVSIDMMCDAGGILQPVTEAVRQVCKEKVRAEPTIEVEPVKHGQWIRNKEGSEFVCSVCGGFAPLNYYNCHRVCSEYCPHCGAKIDL